MNTLTHSYPAPRAARTQTVALRTLNYHIRMWGDAPRGASAPAAHPPIFLLHGWMDVGASWQFVVDALSDGFAQQRTLIAPDWRGFGHTRVAAPVDSYHFVDYLADLEQLLDHFAPGQQVDLVGHSMGGNVAMLYAGARPARIRRLVNLEGFGLPQTQSEQAPARLGQWLDDLGRCQRGEMDLQSYDSAAAVAQRLMKTNPRLAADKAHWLAQQWAAPGADGRWRILGDAAHKIANPQLYRVPEANAIYAAITAPLLSVEAESDSLAHWYQGKYSLDEYHQRLQQVRDHRVAVVAQAGHMLHHDQPQQVARLIEDFVTAP